MNGRSSEKRVSDKEEFLYGGVLRCLLVPLVAESYFWKIYRFQDTGRTAFRLVSVAIRTCDVVQTLFAKK
jgi:hypothetical protein